MRVQCCTMFMTWSYIVALSSTLNVYIRYGGTMLHNFQLTRMYKTSMNDATQLST